MLVAENCRKNRDEGAYVSGFLFQPSRRGSGVPEGMPNTTTSNSGFLHHSCEFAHRVAEALPPSAEQNRSQSSIPQVLCAFGRCNGTSVVV
jgi:hypothetical protein